MTDLAINGRFLTQPQSGVQRYALELLKAWAARGRVGAKVLVPQGAASNVVADLGRSYEIERVGRLRGHAWEQTELRVGAGGAFLINLGNTAPIGRQNQLVVIHDAAVWRQPKAFSWRFRSLYKILLPAIANASRSLATVSKFSASELMSQLGLRPRKIDIIPNGGDHILGARPDPTTLERFRLERERYFLAVGSANPSKNLALLACLEPILAANGLQLVIAGRQIPLLFAAHRRLETAHIRPIDDVTDGELRALYENALCLVFPSTYEGFGIPPIEAMFCGCPVLASNVASIPEVCADAAHYFDPHDPQSLLSSVNEFLGSGTLQGELREAGRSRAKLFTWAKSAEALAAVIDG
jgi:glycosyltransferase involved in cell wall biosynthesis